MIDPTRHNHQIALLELDPHPIVVLPSDIEIPASSKYIPDLLILVKMLMEEVLDLLFVAR